MLNVVQENYEIRIEKVFLDLLKNPESVVVCARHGEIFVCPDADDLISSDRVYGIQPLNSGIFKLPEDLILETTIKVGDVLSITAQPVFLSKGKFKLEIRRKKDMPLEIVDMTNVYNY